MRSTVRWTAPVALGLGLSCAPIAQPNSRTGPEPGVPIRDRYAAARLDLLEAINADRAAAARPPVALDSLATLAAQTHARAMADGGFFSHYGQAGEAPYERLAEAGGTAHVQENVFRWQQRAENPAFDIDPWEAFDIRQAQTWLMGSPSHRATILDHRRTGVGLGIEVDRARGAVYVVQDFTVRSVALEAPALAWRRSPTPLSGRVLAAGLRPLLVVLRRERHPRPWEGGNRPPPRGPYPDGSGEPVILPPWAIQWNPTGRSFAAHLPIGRESEPGLYYGIVYVAPDRVVLDALFERSVSTGEGWPGAAFVVEVR